MTKKEISEILGIDQNTIKNWERNRPKLHKIVMEHFNEKRECPDYENADYMINEISNDLKKLPINQIKIIFYTIKTKLAEMGY